MKTRFLGFSRPKNDTLFFVFFAEKQPEPTDIFVLLKKNLFGENPEKQRGPVFVFGLQPQLYRSRAPERGQRHMPSKECAVVCVYFVF